jgi:hypothetical protein
MVMGRLPGWPRRAGSPDHITTDGLCGRSVGPGRAGAGAAVDRSLSAPCTLRGRMPVYSARLCAVSWAVTVVLDRQLRAAVTAAGIQGRAQLVSRQQHPGGVA